MTAEPAGGSRRTAQSRPADRGMGGRGRHRRRRHPRAHHGGGRASANREGRALRRRGHDLRRAFDRPADAGPPVARASGQSRPPALGRRLPRLRPARPAERVQVGGLRALPGDARPSARAHHAPADAGRTGPAGAQAMPRGRRMSRAITSIPIPAMTSSAAATTRPAPSASLPIAATLDPNAPDNLGPHRPQRALPLRLRQEVQALPRHLRLTKSPHAPVLRGLIRNIGGSA